MENTSSIGLVAAEITPFGRRVAVAQQIKDTLTIIGMNIMLIFGIICGVAIPGLVLYFLRWRLARGKGTQYKASLIWAFGMMHELLCVVLFLSADIQAELREWATYLAWGYMLGLIINLLGLAESLTNRITSVDSLPQ